MLQVDSDRRATIDELRQHPWVTEGKVDKIEFLTNERPPEEINQVFHNSQISSC